MLRCVKFERVEVRVPLQDFDVFYNHYEERLKSNFFIYSVTLIVKPVETWYFENYRLVMVVVVKKDSR